MDIKSILMGKCRGTLSDLPSYLMGGGSGTGYTRTDLERTFSRSPSAGSASIKPHGRAIIKTVRGNTVKFKQFVENGNFASRNGWAVYSNRGTAEVSDNILTFTKTVSSGVDSIYRQDIPYIPGHKYFATIEVNPSSDIRTYLSVRAAYFTSVGLSDMVDVPANKWTTICGITEYNHSYTSFALGTSSSAYLPLGEKFMVRNAMLFDLTEMFGVGNEPSTVEEFRAMFPNEYYAYSEQPTLLSFVGNGIKSYDTSGNIIGSCTIPTATYFPDGMKSEGNVYDELLPNKAIKRIGEDGSALETPVETAIDPPLNLSYIVDNGGEEEMTVKTGVTETAPFSGVVEYSVSKAADVCDPAVSEGGEK